MKPIKLSVQTNGERFYSITDDINQVLSKFLSASQSQSGMLHLFIKHTSCALTINESYDPGAAQDMANFLKHIAPRDLAFIVHDDEGPDDSPSHMKSILLQNHLSFMVDETKILMGQWQGVYLAEFRDAPKTREVLVKFVPDPAN